MNHTYRLVWNESTQRYVPAAESTRARRKSGGSKTLTRLTTVVLAASLGSTYAGSVLAGPTGGQVTSGSGGITQGGNSTVINQQSQNLAINWSSFSIGANESVRFNQPNSSAIALNRVVGQDPSAILGTLSANGQVFVLNPNGVLFGKGAAVNVGALVASSLNLSDADFQAGHYQLAAGGSAGKVVNEGNLTAAAGGYLALVGPNVSNNGSMKVTSGTVLLAAGNKVSLQLNNGSLLSYSIDQGAVNALAQNNQLIQADGGRVFLSAKGADAVSKAVVNNTGIIEAQTVDNHDGVIRLLGDSAVGQVNVGGTLDASAPHGGDGGSIETSAAQVKVADDARVTTAAAAGKTGSWLVDPTDFTIAASGGDISGATLGSELATTSVTLASTSGKVSGNGDIFVNDAVSWSANTTLTLTAVRNIQINNTITATGNTAGLVLTYGSGDNYYINAGGKVTLSGTSPSLTIGGVAYTVINSLGAQNDTSSTTLQGIKNNLSGNYALGSDIDASPTSGWTANQGLTGLMPLGNTTTAFTGKLAGLGHVISNLTVNYQNNNDVGLFGVTGTAAVVRDVGLNNATFVGNDYVGPLIGLNQGAVLDSYAGGTVNDQHYMGGLIGQNNGTVTGSYATTTLTSKNKLAGGLVGVNNTGATITTSYATGAVTGVNKQLGGLVGENLGTISNSYATGSVGGGSAQMGGLVGDNYGAISGSYSTGKVTVSATTSTVGGLVGQNESGGTVTNSFWDTTTSTWSTSSGGTGMTTANMQTQANFTSATAANGSVNPAWDFSGVWQMSSGSTYPLLRGFMKPLTITANNVSTTYTSAAWNGSDTYTCSITCTGLSGTITFGGAAAGAINVGNYSIVPGGLYSSSQQGYSITFVSGQLTITPASLAITGITAANKVYDGSVTATLSGTAKVSPLGSDSGSITLGGTGTGAFANKNVGTGKAVSVTGYTITGAAASNYTLVEPVGLTANITPANLAVTGLAAANKVYDATVAASLTGTATINPFGSDNVSLSGTGTGVFASKNVGTGKAVTVSGYTLIGTDASNYTLVEPTNLTANVTAANLVIGGLTANSKVYDATLADSLSGTATISALAGDSVTLGGTGSAAFASKGVGTGKAVTVTGYTLSGADAGNYTLVEPTGLTANITAASLAIGGLTATNKIYDATLVDTLSGTGTINPLGTDSVTLSGTASAVFGSKNVGTGKSVTVTGYTLTGTDAGNYTLVEPTSLTANITPASLNITGLTATNKIYDATVADSLSGTATVKALGTDSVTLGGTGSAVFANKNVGTAKGVTVSGYTLSGADAGNYTLIEPFGLTANIAAANLNITGLTANNKIYDATVGESLSGTATISALGTDNVTLGGTGSAVFANKNVGTGKAVTVSGYTLSGADAGNYILVEPTSLTANITPASLNITGLTATNKIYDATAAATLSGTGVVSALGTDNVTLGGTGSAVFANKNVGNGKAITVTGYTLSGTDAGNYTLIEPFGLTANISPASLNITGLTGTNKVYDGTVADGLSGTATVKALATDSVTLGGTGSAVFANKNVGNGKAITVTGYTLSGTDAGNYTLIEPFGLTANITAASLNITGLTANNKIYDATTAATLSGTAVVSALGTDNVTLGGTGSAAFANKNVGTGKAVTVTGYTLNGTDAGNYTLVEPTSLTANITPANLLITGLTANNKVYDALTGATLSGTATVNALGNDIVSLGGTGAASFANKNVGTGKAVTVTGYTLNGTDAGNYTLVEPTSLTANITPTNLLITGLTANNKVYDALTGATLSGTATVNALGNDIVSLGGTGAAAFANKNVGTGKAVTVTGYTLNGTDAGNYTLVEPTSLTANITPANLLITGLTANNKVYDALTGATLSGTATVNALGNDIVSLGGTGAASFANKNVGTGKAVTVTGYTLNGTDAGNYTLVEPTSLTANITPANLLITGLTANNKVYDALTGATLSGTATVNALGNDIVSLGGTGSAAFANKNVGTGKAVTVTGYTLNGTDAGNYTLVEPTSLTANITPANLLITGLTANNKVYDALTGATLSGTATVNALGNDIVSLGGTGSASFANKNVGTGKAVTVTGYTLNGTDAGNYTLVEPTSLTANITPANLLITGLTANNKVYDALTGATLSGTATVNALGTDIVSLGGTGSAAFANKNVGTGKAVTVTGYTLNGTDAGNYTLVEPTSLTANITPANLLITGLTANNKVYDALTGATLSGTATVNALGTDIVSLGGTGSASFANKNVGTGKAVTVTGYTLNGTDAGNYTLVEPTSLTANITPANLLITGLTANNKVYDALTGATLSGTATVNALGTDIVSLGGTGSAAFANKNVGTGKAVTVTGYTLNGTDAGNYTLVEPTSLTANITPANLLVTGLTANNKVYDALTGATLSGTATVNALGTDIVSLGGTGAASFANKNVGTGKAVTVTGYTLNGTDAGNYTLVEPTSLTANITPANLLITGLTANNKVYDALTGATLSGTATVNALGTDIVSLGGTGSASFANKNVGTGKAVTVTGYTLNGTDAGNYTLVEPTSLTANITPANLLITGLTANNKVYDALTGATLSGTATVNALGTDIVSLGGTGSAAFANKNVGTGKAVTVTGYTLNGTDAGNYTLVEPTSLTANITPANLLITGLTANNKVYDALTGATLSGTATVNALGNDIVSLGGTGAAAFANKNVGTGKAVTVTGYTLNGTDAGNYTLVEPTSLTANITPANLLITGLTANNKVYDATTAASLSGTATVSALASDVVSIGGNGSAVFATKDVGTGKAVTVTGYSLVGTDAGNYTLVEPTSLTANITPANLAISGLIANNKVYDATATASVTGAAGVVPLGTDSVSLSGTGTAVFADKNVGSNKVVTISGYSLSGTDAGDYVLVQPAGLSATITPANLVVSGITASNKVYDATAVATLTGSASVAAFNGDHVTLGGTANGAFSDKNVGSNKTVTVSGYTLSGSDASNYALVQPTGLTANISPANLAVTGLTALSKVYDTTTAAGLSGTATIAAIGSDNVVLNGTGNGSFADKNVGNNKAVVVSGFSLSGGDAGNYTLVEPTGLTANITPANLLLGGISANNKVYDAGLTAGLSGTAIVNPLGNDVVSVIGTGTATFADKNVGNAKAVTVSGYTLSGTDASNYTLVEPTSLTANITPANLLITGLTANNKVYDALTGATLSGTATVNALGTDIVSLGGTGSAAFANKNVGTGKAVTVTGYTLSGTDAGNYTLVEPTSLTANITPANLLITGLTANNKIYDGTTTASLSGTATIAALGSDNVVLNGTGIGSFADKNVGNNKPVTVTGYSIIGSDAGNYNLLEPTGLTANITPATLSIGGIVVSNKVYDTTVAASLSGTASVTPFGNDNVSVKGTGVGVFSDKNAGANKSVTVSGYTLAGSDAGNYTLLEPTGLSANINPAALTVGGITASTKIYDGTATASLSGTAFVNALGNDIVNITGTGIGSFADKNVGANKPVNISGYALSGSDAANYTLVEPTNVTASITARALTISATGINKVYDGTTTAGVTLADNRVAGDALTTGYGSAAFADQNVGTAKSVSVNGISLTGADARNYTFNTSATTTANITPAPLTITANSATKSYDGQAYFGGAGVTFAGFVAGENPTVLGGSLTYGGSSQGAISVGSYTIVPGGLTSTNYAINFVNGLLTINQAGLIAAINATSSLYDATSTLLQ